MNDINTTMTTIKTTVLISGLAAIFLVVPASLQASGAELMNNLLDQKPAVTQTIEEAPVVQQGGGRF